MHVRPNMSFVKVPSIPIDGRTIFYFNVIVRPVRKVRLESSAAAGPTWPQGCSL